MAFLKPGIGNWYRLPDSDSFEVVAVDEDDGTIEVQYLDGTLEEIDVEEWRSWCEERALQLADASEDWTDAADVEADEGRSRGERYDEDGGLRAGSLDDLDMFEGS